MTLALPYPRAVQQSRSWTEARPATTTGVTITASGTPHALSASFTDLFAATAHDTYWVSLLCHGSASPATQTDALLNIYIGAAAAEVLLIPDLAVGWSVSAGGGGYCKTYEFPLFIPAGSRISAKSRALVGSQTIEVMMQLHGGGEPSGWCGRGVESVGANTAASQGTSVTPGGASEGSFTDIGTTVNAWRYILVMPQGTLTDTNMTTAMQSYDIGVGGATYKSLEEFWFINNGASETSGPLMSRGRFVEVPAGTALQLRGQSSGTAEAMDCLIYGVY
jgi:hypothetical protein